MTWAMIGAAAVTTVGSIVGQQASKRGQGIPPPAQGAPEQGGGAPLQPTAKGFAQPEAGTTQAPQVQGAAYQPSQQQLQSLVMPTIPQSDPLSDYLKHQRSY